MIHCPNYTRLGLVLQELNERLKSNFLNTESFVQGVTHEPSTEFEGAPLNILGKATFS